MSNTLELRGFTLGPWGTNCYVVWTPSLRCWLIDMSFEPGPMLDFVESKGLMPERLILTHAHVDHIAGVAEARRRYPELPIAIHDTEKDYPGDASLNLSLYIDTPTVAPDPTETLIHGQALSLDGIVFEVRHTPGHSPGGIALIQPEHHLAIVGDTLFAGSIGRFDFPTSDGRALIQSIHHQLLTLPDDTRVLPGHGEETTIGRERANNPYLRETDLV